VIVALVGTSHLEFRRFIDAVSKLKNDCSLDCIIQYGHSSLDGTDLEGFDFCSNNDLLELMSKSELIVCQAGFGSMFDAIKSGNRVIVIPRKIDFGETDAEQDSLANHYANLGLVELCDDPGELTSVYKNHGIDRVPPRMVDIPLVKDVLSEFIK
jgi:UDP-N-acetylglucosamine transferase subunit ALG13